MSNGLQIFNNPEFGQVRTLTIDNEPFFVGKDVAEILGYAKPLNALASHVDEDDSLKRGLIDSLGRKQDTIIINESGLYSLILSSKLPEARRFKRWVTSEVLPAIRKTGSYGKQMSQVEILAQAAQQLVEQERELARLRLDNEEIRKEQKIQSSRIDTLNGVCTEGTKRQKLVAMVQAYAVKSGLTFREGWHRFRAAYNTAFHTSIGNSIAYYMKENGLKKKPGTPEYLEKKGLLDDALRIADKLLNGSVA
ncbi:Bro-N domain-containing protein [Selenomonas sp. ND2010]|uniref:BRO-N domain-containing protein n=1 Tax=Selenomonas sp. ND2010 TaxID=1410618 RepID=UPI00068FDC55|nr:BRO family protein [Selenomonas sp. ND2010]